MLFLSCETETACIVNSFVRSNVQIYVQNAVRENKEIQTQYKKFIIN
jgi:hypothetical protein